MREIRFRAWDGQQMYRVGRLGWSFRSGVPIWFETESRPYGSRGEWKTLEHNKVVLMQYIGLKDRDGTDIYEGDIVNYIYGASLAQRIVEIAWKTRLNYAGWNIGAGEHYKVVGNIYENPGGKF